MQDILHLQELYSLVYPSDPRINIKIWRLEPFYGFNMHLTIISVFIQLILFRHVALNRCGRSFEDRSVPNHKIKFLQDKGAYIEKNCPLFQPNGTSLEMYEIYVLGTWLQKGACITKKYEKGSIPYQYGFTDNNTSIENAALRRGGGLYTWPVSKKRRFYLPYSIIYTTIDKHHVRDINSQKNIIIFRK